MKYRTSHFYLVLSAILIAKAHTTWNSTRFNTTSTSAEVSTSIEESADLHISDTLSGCIAPTAHNLVSRSAGLKQPRTQNVAYHGNGGTATATLDNDLVAVHEVIDGVADEYNAGWVIQGSLDVAFCVIAFNGLKNLTSINVISGLGLPAGHVTKLRLWISLTTHDIYTGRPIRDAESLFLKGNWIRVDRQFVYASNGFSTMIFPECVIASAIKLKVDGSASHNQVCVINEVEAISPLPPRIAGHGDKRSNGGGKIDEKGGDGNLEKLITITWPEQDSMILGPVILIRGEVRCDLIAPGVGCGSQTAACSTVSFLVSGWPVAGGPICCCHGQDHMGHFSKNVTDLPARDHC